MVVGYSTNAHVFETILFQPAKIYVFFNARQNKALTYHCSQNNGIKPVSIYVVHYRGCSVHDCQQPLLDASCTALPKLEPGLLLAKT